MSICVPHFSHPITMDNRRVLSQNSRRSSLQGIFSTVKRIFSRQGLNEPEAAAPNQPQLLRLSQVTAAKVDSKPSLPGTFETTIRKRGATDDCLPLPQPAVKRVHRTVLTNTLGTPNHQVLSRRASQFLTPDYTPHYHTIANTLARLVRRVYQFSGLPSPYQTRIKPPRSRRGLVNALRIIPLANLTFDAAVLTNTPAPAHKSKTYETLESILDGSMLTPKLSKESSGLKPASKKNPFGNPYAAEGGAQRNVSAKDVTKTLAFDKSKPLEADKKERIQPESAAPPKTAEQSSKLFTFASDSNGTAESKPSFTFKPSPIVLGEEQTKNVTPVAKEAAKQFSFSSNPTPPNNPVSQVTPPAKENAPKAPVIAPVVPAQEIPTTKAPIKHTTTNLVPALASFTNVPPQPSLPKAGIALFNPKKSSSAASEFVFPHIVVKQVNIDENDVAKEKHLFVF